MKKKLSSARTLVVFFCVLTLFVGLIACESDEGTSRKGLFKLELEVDTMALSSNIQTKAAKEEFAEFLKTEDYAVKILQGSTVVNNWERLDKMPESIELDPGTYQVNVSKGVEEGAAFESPYFVGSSQFLIQEGMTTPLSVSASMANAKVTFEYSNDFIEAYTAYELTLKSAKMALPIVYKKGETRALFFKCDTAGTKVQLGMVLTNIYGKEITYNTSFTAKPKEWLRLNVKTDGEAINGIAIDIILNDEVVKTEHVMIGIPDFMDELKGAPFFLLTDGSPFHWVTDEKPDPMIMDVGEFGDNASLSINAPGKMGKCQLIIKKGKEAVFDYDLVNLTDEGKKVLEDKWKFHLGEGEGFDFPLNAKGAYTATLDLLNLLNELDGEATEVLYTGTLKVSDLMPIPNETEATFKVKLNAVAAPKITFNTNFINEMNEGAIPEGKIEAEQTISVLSKGRIKTCKLAVLDGAVELYSKNIESVGTGREDIVLNKSDIVGDKEATISFKEAWFKSLLATPEGAKDYTIKLIVKDNVGNETVGEMIVKVNPPVFEWAMAENDGDVFAKYAILKIKAPNKDYVKFYQNGVCISEGAILSEKNGVISFTWKGLNGSTSYSNIIAKYKDYALDPIDIETETEIYLGDKGKLEKWEAEGGAGHADVSWGKYSHRPYRSWEKWTISGWETLNEKTTQFGGENERGPHVAVGVKSWTRYVANSGTIRTAGYGEGYGALIRTIGWGAGNTGGGSASIINEITPGELYLGTYDKGAPIYGINFSSRPLGFSFKYKYESKNQDRFIAKIEIKQGNEIIAEGSFNNAEIENRVDDWTDGKVVLQYVGQNASLKATSMCILFKSGTSTDKDDIMTFAGFANLTDGENVGSKLYIDNVELIYDYE